MGFREVVLGVLFMSDIIRLQPQNFITRTFNREDMEDAVPHAADQEELCSELLEGMELIKQNTVKYLEIFQNESAEIKSVLTFIGGTCEYYLQLAREKRG